MCKERDLRRVGESIWDSIESSSSQGFGLFSITDEQSTSRIWNKL